MHEAELCRRLLDKMKGDVMHLDMIFGGVSIEELSPIEFTYLRASRTGRQQFLKILSRLRKIAGEKNRLYDVDTLAIGKKSIPVRIAELTAGADAILFASKKAVDEKEPVLLGLPRCRPIVHEDCVDLQSLTANEHDVRRYALDTGKILTKVKLSEMLNPSTRGFPALRIKPMS